jgi:hypothetical protein
VILLPSRGLQFDKVNLQVGDLQRLGDFSLYSIYQYNGFNSTNMGIFGELEIDLSIGFLDFLGEMEAGDSHPASTRRNAWRCKTRRGASW